MKQLTAEKFLDELKKATEWKMTKELYTGAFVLTVKDPDSLTGMSYFIGPNPVYMSDHVYREFLEKVKTITESQ